METSEPHYQNQSDVSMRNKFVTKALPSLSVAFLTLPTLALPEDFPDGIEFGVSDRALLPYLDDLNLMVEDGGLHLYSGAAESSFGSSDGGVFLYGKPVRMFLGATGTNDGTFEIYANDGFPSSPLLFIDSAAETAAFNGVDVSVSNGTLSVGGSPVLSQASSTSYLSGQGFLQLSGFNSALATSTPPTSTAWQAAYLPRGTTSGNALLSWEGGTASAGGAIAIGNGTIASHSYAQAIGVDTTASGPYSIARGYQSSALGTYSTANGLSTSAKSAAETVFGWYNLESSPVNSAIWNGLDGLFRLGNGNSSGRSDAMTVLKSGQTTLTNKEWKAAVTADPDAALDDPASTTDSGGEALVVDGHTRLNGKVIVTTPQGDISMGIYGN